MSRTTRTAFWLLALLTNVPPASALTLSLPADAGAPPAGSMVVPLSVDDASGMLGTDILIAYDPTVALATGVSKTSVSENQTLTANLSPSGSIRISLFGTTPLSGGGALLNLSFTSTGSAGSRTPLDLVSASVNEGAVPAALKDGRYCVQGLVGEVRNLTLTPDAPASAKAVLFWGADPFAESYNLYRAGEPDLRDLACVLQGAPGPPVADDGSTPAAGRAFFMLVTAANCRGESSLGFSSSGGERVPAARCL